MGGDSSWQASYSDPLRARPDGSAGELRLRAPPQVEEVQNDLCSVKMVMMHRPTHNSRQEKSGEYPFSWHLSEKKRLWELRLQIRFNKVPEGKVFFGVELEKFVAVSGITKQAQKALVSACKGVVGDCYHTVGDDPAAVQGEREAPAFVMPLWAFDQFHVADPGSEPSLLSDLEGVGMKRSDGVKQYISAMQSMINSFSEDKVYTFCFWGTSKFLDIMRWEVVGGLVPGVKLDFSKLCGAPPIFLTMYEMPETRDGEKRHLPSRKNQYFRAAVWSTIKPAKVEEASECTIDYWSGMTGFEGLEETVASKPVPVPQQDLLGMDLAPAVCAPAGKADVSTDLLGLF